MSRYQSFLVIVKQDSYKLERNLNYSREYESRHSLGTGNDERQLTATAAVATVAVFTRETHAATSQCVYDAEIARTLPLFR